MLSYNRLNDDNQDYQLVSREFATTRFSGLYRFVLHLIRQNAPEVAGYRVGISSSETREAIFLNFSKDNLNLFQHLGYARVDCHLTIDSKYAVPESAKGKRGFTYAHHTERYRKAGVSDLIVRTYFDEQGEYLFHKISSEPDAKNPVPFVSPDAVLQNATLSKQALTALLKKKKSICESLNSEIDQLETRLADMLREIILNQAEIQPYLELGAQFLLQIKNLNFLIDGVKDLRETQMQQMINAMQRLQIQRDQQRQHKAVLESQSNDLPPDPLLPIVVDKKPDTANKKESVPLSLSEEKNKIFKKLKKLNKQLITCQTQCQTHNLKVDFVIKLHTIAHEILLLQIVAMSFGKLTQEENASLQEGVDITRNLISIESVFEYYFSTGHVGSFKQLFEFSNHLNAHFCLKVLQSVCVANVDDPSLTGKLAIAEFLFQNSSEYRLYTHLSEYMLTADINDVKAVDVSASLFFLAAQRDNKQAFKTLLDQGFDPNINGITLMGRIAFPLLRSLLLLPNPVPYVEMLLEYEVDLGVSFRPVTYLHSQEDFLKKHQSKQSFSKTKKHPNAIKPQNFSNEGKAPNSDASYGEIIQLLDSVEEPVQALMLKLLFPSLLYLAAQEHHYVLFPNFFKERSPWELALTLARCVNNETKDISVAAVRTLANAEAIQFFRSPNILEEKVKALKSENSENLKRFGFFVSCTNVEKARALNALWNKLKQCENIEETISQCESLLTLPLSNQQKKDVYVACIILMFRNPAATLTAYGKQEANLTVEDKYRLVQWCEAAYRICVECSEFKQATNFLGWAAFSAIPRTLAGKKLKEAVRTLAYYILGYQLPPLSFIPAETGGIELKTEIPKIFEVSELSNSISPMVCIVQLRESKEIKDINRFFKETLEACRITEEAILEAQCSLQADRLYRGYLQNASLQKTDIGIPISTDLRNGFIDLPLINGQTGRIDVLESLHLAELLLIALKSSPTVKDRENMIGQCFALGNIYIQQKDHVRAHHYLQVGLSVPDTYLEGNSFKQLDEYQKAESRTRVLDAVLRGSPYLPVYASASSTTTTTTTTTTVASSQYAAVSTTTATTTTSSQSSTTTAATTSSSRQSAAFKKTG